MHRYLEALRICSYIHVLYPCIYIYLSDIVVSLEYSEYVVYKEHGPLSVTIMMSDIALQDVIVEVTITDGTAEGK